jgi:hypothetical protein
MNVLYSRILSFGIFDNLTFFEFRATIVNEVR